MYKKLVQYDDWHFVEVDPVCLRRTAAALREQIVQKIPRGNDPYGFYTRTMPLIEKALNGEISNSLDQDACEFVSKNFLHDESEGGLPPSYDSEFSKAVSEFSATIEGLALDDFEDVVIDGVTFGWVEFEDEGDWPDKVKHR